MKNIINLKKHIKSDTFESLYKYLKELNLIDLAEEHYKKQTFKLLSLELRLEIEGKWPPKFSEYVRWSSYEDMQEHFAKWLRRICECGSKKEKEAVIDFLEEKGFPENVRHIIGYILEEVKGEKDLERRVRKVLEEKSFSPEKKINLKEEIYKKIEKEIDKKTLNEAKKFYDDYLHLIECDKCFAEMNKVIDKFKEKAIKIAAKGESVFLPVVEYKEIYWDFFKDEKSGLGFLIIKFKRKEENQKTENYFAVYPLDSNGFLNKLEFEITYKDKKESKIKTEIIEIDNIDVEKIKIEDIEYKIKWKKEDDNKPYPFIYLPFLFEKEEIKKEEISKKFMEKKDFYENFFGKVDEKCKKFLKDLLFRWKFEIEEIETIENINKLIDFIK